MENYQKPIFAPANDRMVSTSTQAKSGVTDYIEFHDTFLIAQLLVLGYCYQRMLHQLQQ